MQTLKEQLREALGEIDDETGIIICVSSKEERIIDAKTLLPALLTEYEKLEREAAAGRELAESLKEQKCMDCNDDKSTGHAWNI